MKRILLLSLGIVLLDQITKVAVKGFDLFGVDYDGMSLGESIPLLGNTVRLTFVENPGMAFGLDFGLPFLLGLFSIAAATFLVYLIRKSHEHASTGFLISLGLILGGAVGNLIDRVFYGVFYGYSSLFYGRVVDFIDVDIPDIFGQPRFWIFNIADSAVSVGIVLLILFYPKEEVVTDPATAHAPERGEGTRDPGDRSEDNALTSQHTDS